MSHRTGQRKLIAGVIGAGWVAGDRHIPALKRDGRVEVAVVFDKDPLRARALADRYGIDVSTSDMDHLFDLATDFVSVCTPPTAHAANVIEALEAGCHVFVEKPMAINPAEAEAMIAAAEATDRRLCVSHNLLFSRSVRKALNELQDAGPVQHVFATQLSSPRRRLPTWYQALPGGLFFDESPHVLYLLRRILGDFSIDDVRARFESGSESNAIELLEARLSNGQTSANLTLAFKSPVSEWKVSIVTTRKVITLDLFRDIITVVHSDGRHGPSEILRGSMGAGLQSVAGFVTSGALYASKNLLYGHERIISAFVDNVMGGPPAVELTESLAVVRATQTILEKAGVVKKPVVRRRKVAEVAA